MRSGQTLIKLAKHKVDSVQKLLLAARKTYEDSERKLGELERTKEREMELATRDPELAATYSQYLKGWNLQRSNIEATMAGVNEQIISLERDLGAAFEEQKKFETIEERRRLHEIELGKKREAKMMDNFAITRRRSKF